ncbi:hypothetical protein [Echinicola rosea]|uniref:Uncharacterized protein n=1 Tax=Echinicola rosea TaxID=1807691 RepID=A0ABQ1VCW1_9BACT|nr:hypothetical protein [Echinicola rosea]GGF49728.1 hypothetical protein GCM10011339_42900 [Echinicola rosea]
MDEKVKRLLKVYSELDWDSRKAVRDFIMDFEKEEYSEKRKINESLNKSLGPLMTNTCPYCGK